MILLANDEESGYDGDLHVSELISSEKSLNGKNIGTNECAVIEFLGAGGTSEAGLNTVKLEGFLRGIPIVILVDSGATHNFVSSD